MGVGGAEIDTNCSILVFYKQAIQLFAHMFHFCGFWNHLVQPIRYRLYRPMLMVFQIIKLLHYFTLEFNFCDTIYAFKGQNEAPKLGLLVHHGPVFTYIHRCATC